MFFKEIKEKPEIYLVNAEDDPVGGREGKKETKTKTKHFVPNITLQDISLKAIFTSLKKTKNLATEVTTSKNVNSFGNLLKNPSV